MRKNLLFLFSIFLLFTLVYPQEKAYNFYLQDLSGKFYRLSDFKGKIVILNFFATWCRFCRREMPELVSIASEYKDKVQVISVSVDRNPEEVLPKFISDYKINFPVLLATDEVISGYGGLTEGIPYTVVIDKNGVITNTYLGARKKEVFEADINKLLK